MLQLLYVYCKNISEIFNVNLYILYFIENKRYCWQIKENIVEH